MGRLFFLGGGGGTAPNALEAGSELSARLAVEGLTVASGATEVAKKPGRRKAATA